jgi:hypothetical protein
VLVISNPTVNAAENLDRYWSILTGDQQTPPVTTDAIGYVGLKFQDDRTRLLDIVNSEHIGKVTAVNLYQIDKEQNGTIVRPVTFTKETQEYRLSSRQNSAGKDKRNSIYGWCDK